MSKLLTPLGAVLAGLLSVLIAGTLVVPAPARAAEKVIDDGAEPSLPARMDILTVEIDNRVDRVVLRVTFRDLVEERRARTKVFIGTDPATDAGFIAYSRHRPGTEPLTQLWVPTDQEFGGTPVACAGVRGKWRFDKNRVRIVVPQSCLASTATRYRFKAVSGFYGTVGDWTAFRRVARG
ncbi:hypothetical protein FHP29_13635 [Nocardioides albidus]|uniref:Uncharacterized protein n=1 Tax=Nocardioides albidus TaxID=1517589 RepID=A0A5C4VQX5_9ACTN|nr:hypothetical protein [Nocardioides albidus]TNM38312.1 hypothetical protein FHP29_13635 [Nocardioides albidus]